MGRTRWPTKNPDGYLVCLLVVFQWVPNGDNMGFNVVSIGVSPAGCVLRLLKVFYWDLYGVHQMAHKEPRWVPSVFACGISMGPLWEHVS